MKTSSLLSWFLISVSAQTAQYGHAAEDSSCEALASGATDVVVVRSSGGTLSSTSWQAQLGKFGSLLTSREGREVSVFVNSVPARVRMVVTHTGVLHFQSSSSPNHLTEEDLEQLNLKPGVNKGRYVCPELNTILHFSIFLYEAGDKLVITDIDGTITQSDIRGQVLPKLGLSAHHTAVVELFDRIHRRGYRVIYLTARSMGQDEDTRNYLFQSLQKVEGFSLPPGPILFSPTTILCGFITEVVTKTPDLQKTQTVLQLWELFRKGEGSVISNTIVAGYGNKDTDTKAYINAGMDRGRVYLVNPKGELRNEETGLVSSYSDQVLQLDTLYPNIL